MSDPNDLPDGAERDDEGRDRAPHASAPHTRERRPGFVRRHWGKLLLATVVLLPIVVVVVWTTIALGFSYSDGTRTGYNQKLSRKGWLCKTWEGEIALTAQPGVAPEIFRYSVRDDAVAQQIQALEGSRVTLQYEQHKGLPSQCFGETEYFATGVQRATGP